LRFEQLQDFRSTFVLPHLSIGNRPTVAHHQRVGKLEGRDLGFVFVHIVALSEQ
jgi:hypothetical protein